MYKENDIIPDLKLRTIGKFNSYHYFSLSLNYNNILLTLSYHKYANTYRYNQESYWGIIEIGIIVWNLSSEEGITWAIYECLDKTFRRSKQNTARERKKRVFDNSKEQYFEHSALDEKLGDLIYCNKYRKIYQTKKQRNFTELPKILFLHMKGYDTSHYK